VNRWLALVIFTACLPGCPESVQVREDKHAPPDAGPVAGGTTQPDVEVVPRPEFDPDRPPPCESHTACYLSAKEAHMSGKRAGYLLALDLCEYYRGRYQLEKFYGLCLLILGDCYRHLNNYEESGNCYQRYLESQPDDPDLALQAREGLEEVKQGQKEPTLYRRYLDALSLLAQNNREPNPAHLERARGILDSLHTARPDWALSGKVEFLLGQLRQAEPQPGPEAGEVE
jgi:tetratricopeptide (TPR) repeat protein